MARTAAARELEEVVELALALEGEDRPAGDGVVTLVMETHRRGLAKLLALVAGDGPAGPALLARLAADPEVGPLLLLHDLHPVALTTRVSQAIDEARASLRAAGGAVQLVGIEPGGRVHVRLSAAEPDRSASEAAWRLALEEALYAAAPEVGDLVVDAQPPAPFAPTIESCPAGASPACAR